MGLGWLSITVSGSVPIVSSPTRPQDHRQRMAATSDAQWRPTQVLSDQDVFLVSRLALQPAVERESQDTSRALNLRDKYRCSLGRWVATCLTKSHRGVHECLV